MASYTEFSANLSPMPGTVYQAFGIPAGDMVTAFYATDGGSPAWIRMILKSTLTGAAAFTANAGYASDTYFPIGSFGWDSAGTLVRKTAAATWA